MNSSFLVRLELTKTEKIKDGYRHYRAILDAHSSAFPPYTAQGIVKLPYEWTREIPGLEPLTLGDFLNDFRAGQGRVSGGGLQVGRWLYSHLLGKYSPLRSRWEAARREMETAALPLRLEIMFPHPAQFVDSEISLEELPFELMSDEHALLFQNPGYTLVRSYETHKKKTFDVQRGTRALLAWANPKRNSPGLIPDKDIDEHVRAFKDLNGRPGWHVAPPCEHATEEKLRASLRKAKPPILSIVAHGLDGGGVLLLESPDGDASNLKPVTLAEICRAASVEVVMLWTCHSARWRPDVGSLTEALLHHTKGNVTAVISAHGRLEAAATATIIRALLESFASSETELDQALFSARFKLEPNNIQWALPVYYARPDSGRSVRNAAGPRDPMGSPAPFLGLQDAPSVPAHFIGREELLSQGLELLRREKDPVRVVSAVGVPGIGKSAVARKLADTVMEELGIQRALWISADRTDARELRTHIAVRFLPRGAYQREAYEHDIQLAHAIGNTPLLLVFDSAEVYLWDTQKGANRLFRELLSTLLASCPHLRVLLATQEALREKTAAIEEGELPVKALSSEEAKGLILSLTGYDSPETVSAEELHILESILEKISGHPRALTLVAGQLTWRKPEEVLASLRAGDLESIKSATSSSQNSELESRDDRLSSSFHLVYNHLGRNHPSVAEAFAWMGLALPAGASYKLLENIFQGDDRRTVAVLKLENLVDDEGGTRLFIPSPLNAYARSRAASVPQFRSNELLGRTFAAYAQWLTEAREFLGTPHGPQALKEALADTPNIEALSGLLGKGASRSQCGQIFSSWAHLMLSAGPASRVLPVLGQSLMYLRSTDWNFRWVSGLYYRSKRLTATLLKSKLPPRDEPLAQVLEALGRVHARMDDKPKAERAYREALWRYRSVGDDLGEAHVHRALGDLYARNPQHHEAEAEYLKALKLYQQLGASLGEAETQQSLGELHSRQENTLENAHITYTKARALFQQAGSPLGEAHSCRLLGNLQSKLLRHSEAETAYEEALRIYRHLEWQPGVAEVCKALGDLHLKTHAWQKAEGCFSEALQIHRKLESRRGEASTRKSQGDLFRMQSKWELAEQALEEAQGLFQQLGDRSGMASTRKSQGDLFRMQSKLELAEQALEEAQGLFQQLGDRSGMAYTRQSQGELFRMQDKLELAEQALDKAQGLFQQLGDRSGMAYTRQSQGDLFRMQDKWELAEQALEEAQGLFQQLGDRSGMAYMRQSQGELFRMQSKWELAEQALEEAQGLFQQLGDRSGMAYTRQSQGELFRMQDKWELAKQSLEEALGLFQQVGDQRGLANTHVSRGELFTKLGRFQDAEEAYSEALRLSRNIDYAWGTTTAVVQLAKLISRRGAVRADQDTLEEALKLHRQRKAVAGEIQVLKALGDLEAHGSRHALAYGHYLQALSLAEQHTDLSGTSELYVRAAKVSLAANLPEFGLYWSTHALDLLSIGAVPLPQARLLRVTALQLLADCARSLGYPIANDALRAAWYLALEQRHPDALQFESQLADQVPGFNPSVRPTSEELQALGGRISELMRSHDEGLVLRGIHVRRPFGTA